jgi:hypothetical protein
LSTAKGTACRQFSNVKNIAKPTQAHIHRGAEGVSGPIVIVFGTSYGAKGCAKAAKGLIEKIETNPNRYYVNIHNAATGRARSAASSSSEWRASLSSRVSRFRGPAHSRSYPNVKA